MRARPRRCGLLAAALLIAHLVCAGAHAGDSVELDSTRSRADFRVKVIWLVGIHGSFGSVHGDVTIDPFRSEAIVDARIDANSVHMHVRGYEDWVKSPEFFDAKAHPQIRFVSEPFPLQRLHNGGELPGTLTLRGVSQAVRFELAPATCARPGYDCAIAAAATISRVPFGMRSRLGTLSEKVDLGLSVYLAPADNRLAP